MLLVVNVRDKGLEIALGDGGGDERAHFLQDARTFGERLPELERGSKAIENNDGVDPIICRSERELDFCDGRSCRKRD